MNNKILLLAHCFPPYVFPESYLATKYIGSCVKYEVDVITMKPFFKWVKTDQKFLLYAKDKSKNITYLFPPKFYKKLPFHRVEGLFSIPDAYLYLNYLYLLGLKEVDRYDAIITWSMYHSIHLVGRKIKRKFPQIKWIAHFSDPWTTNPFFKKNKLVFFINKMLEKKVFKSADALTFTSAETVKQSLSGYSSDIKSKAYIIPHSYDEKLFNATPNKKNDKFFIRYLGSFYRARQPFSLLLALEKIKIINDNLLQNIVIEFIGSADREYSVSECLKNNVVFLEPIEYMSSLKKMTDAQILITIDAPFLHSPFLPSKLIDYIGANKPIFGVTPPGAAQKLIEEMGFPVAHPNKPDEIADKLSKMIEAVKSGEISCIPEEIRNRFKTSTIGKQVEDLIENVCQTT